MFSPAKLSYIHSCVSSSSKKSRFRRKQSDSVNNRRHLAIKCQRKHFVFSITRLFVSREIVQFYVKFIDGNRKKKKIYETTQNRTIWNESMCFSKNDRAFDDAALSMYRRDFGPHYFICVFRDVFHLRISGIPSPNAIVASVCVAPQRHHTIRTRVP